MFEPKTGITVHLLVYNQHILGYATKVFGNYLIFRNVRVVFGQFLENVRKSSKSYRKSSETRQKCYQYVDIIKIKNTGKTWLLVDMEYFFSCSTLYVTRSLRSLDIEFKTRNDDPYLLYLSVSTHAVIGQFSRPYSPVWPAEVGFVAKLFLISR